MSENNIQENIIRMENVSKIYTLGQEQVKALDGASLTVEQGEMVSIIGPSGSGKSTLMNIVGCLDRDFQGEYELNGLPVRSYGEDELARIRSEQIGFIFQNFNLISTLTARENVELPLIYRGAPKGERDAAVEQALERVGLSDRMGHRPEELSGGQQQRVAIARALVGAPVLFLGDEPTGNLDSRTGREIMGIFHELHDRGNTVILITHNEDIAAETERIIRISDGHVTEVM